MITIDDCHRMIDAEHEAENRGYRMGIKALLDAFSDRIPKVQWLWMLQDEAERLLKESKR